MCTVVNKYKSPYDIYIGRGSKWGNPFVIGKDGDREEVIAKFKSKLWEAIESDPALVEELKTLKGKALGCFCKPKPCHGDVIQYAVAWAVNQPKVEIQV